MKVPTRGAVCPLAITIALMICATPLRAAESALTESAAIEHALRDNPRLSALRESIAAHEAATLQARKRPNPELSFEVEEIRFSDGPDLDTVSTDPVGSTLGRSTERSDNAGFAGSELTLSVSQRIELGRKRGRRIALADSATRVALWDYEAARADIVASTRRAYVQVLGGQERTELRRQLAEVAKAAESTVRARVAGGKVSQLQGDRAEIVYAQARIAVTAAERELSASRASLAFQWGSFHPEFASVIGELSAVPPLPSLTAVEDALDNNPDIARWTAEISRRDEATGVERARAIPDLTLIAGWRNTGLPDSTSTSFGAGGAISGFERSHFDDERDNSLVLGLSIPLPLFDRNQGGIREAEHRALQAAHERGATRIHIAEGVIRIHERLQGLVDELRVLREEVVPLATRTYEATKVGFEQGKFEYLIVLDAQRTLFEVRNQHLEALAAYRLGVVDLERLLGLGLDAFPAGLDTEDEEL